MAGRNRKLVFGKVTGEDRMTFSLRKTLGRLMEVHPNDLATFHWGWVLLITFGMGGSMLGAYSLAFVGLCHEASDVGPKVIPAMIFAGLMTLGGSFITLGGLLETAKKIGLIIRG